mmetsp:Transcript_66836/g.157454  ORF Transcript_66836/g.157454 Transcript_66836/m.157454 type:complete len:289 (+) Transcript_66836:368-1234(+)
MPVGTDYVHLASRSQSGHEDILVALTRIMLHDQYGLGRALSSALPQQIQTGLVDSRHEVPHVALVPAGVPQPPGSSRVPTKAFNVDLICVNGNHFQIRLRNLVVVIVVRHPIVSCVARPRGVLVSIELKAPVALSVDDCQRCLHLVCAGCERVVVAQVVVSQNGQPWDLVEWAAWIVRAVNICPCSLPCSWRDSAPVEVVSNRCDEKQLLALLLLTGHISFQVIGHGPLALARRCSAAPITNEDEVILASLAHHRDAQGVVSIVIVHVWASQTSGGGVVPAAVQKSAA